MANTGLYFKVLEYNRFLFVDFGAEKGKEGSVYRTIKQLILI